MNVEIISNLKFIFEWISKTQTGVVIEHTEEQIFKILEALNITVTRKYNNIDNNLDLVNFIKMSIPEIYPDVPNITSDHETEIEFKTISRSRSDSITDTIKYNLKLPNYKDINIKIKTDVLLCSDTFKEYLYNRKKMLPVYLSDENINVIICFKSFLYSHEPYYYLSKLNTVSNIFWFINILEMFKIRLIVFNK